MYCIKCGTQNTDDSLFCNNCGKSISNLKNEEGNIIVDDIIAVKEDNLTSSDIHKKTVTKKSKKIFFYIAITLLITTILILGYYIYGLTKENSDLKENLSKVNLELTNTQVNLDKASLRVDELIEKYNKLSDEAAKTSDTYYKAYKTLNLYKEFAKIVVDGNSSYHTFECSKIQIKEFYIHNLNMAVNLGYTECPECH